MPKDILSGFALPTIVPPGVDHTYVLSSEGHAWGCFGRWHGGRKICQGPGDADTAECLSQPESKAGVEYGVTGVCHQAANRILLSAGITVSRARGYRISAFLYGTYGRDPDTLRFYSPRVFPWPDIIRCNAQ
jgi:hypothetical protein